jgi:hypothetical protein
LNLKDIKNFCSPFGSQVDLNEFKRVNSQLRQHKGWGGFGSFYKTEKFSKLYTVFMYSIIIGKEQQNATVFTQWRAFYVHGARRKAD